MNRTELIGRIGQDAEIKDFNTNQVINFSVAVSERWKDKDGNKQEKTYWYRCAKWGNNTAIAQYLTKGTLVYVSGVCEPQSYINKSGEIVQAQGLTVRNIELLGGGNQSQDQTQQQNRSNTTANALDPSQHNDLPFGNEDDLEF